MREPLLRGRRRTYTAEFKAALVADANRKGASVADIARRHGLNHNLIFKWKREVETVRTTTNLVPVQPLIEPPSEAAPVAPTPACTVNSTRLLRVVFAARPSWTRAMPKGRLKHATQKVEHAVEIDDVPEVVGSRLEFFPTAQNHSETLADSGGHGSKENG